MDSFAALSDPTRRSIIEVLASTGALSAGAIHDHFTISAPAISQHLKVLREADLVQVEKQAQQRIYSINPAAFTEMEQWLHTMRLFWNARLDVLEELLRSDDVLKSKNMKEEK